VGVTIGKKRKPTKTKIAKQMILFLIFFTSNFGVFILTNTLTFKDVIAFQNVPIFPKYFFNYLEAMVGSVKTFDPMKR